MHLVQQNHHNKTCAESKGIEPPGLVTPDCFRNSFSDQMSYSPKSID